MKRHLIKTGLLLTALLLAGCGVAFLPEAVEEPLAPGAPLGTWKYTAEDGESTILLEVKPDGSFAQEVRPAGKSISFKQEGRWEMDERNQLTFDALLTPDRTNKQGNWVPEKTWWYMTQGVGDGPAHVIFGGTHPDPDTWKSFKKIR